MGTPQPGRGRPRPPHVERPHPVEFRPEPVVGGGPGALLLPRMVAEGQAPVPSIPRGAPKALCASTHGQSCISCKVLGPGREQALRRCPLAVGDQTARAGSQGSGPGGAAVLIA